MVEPNFCGLDANVEFRLVALYGNSKKNVHSLSKANSHMKFTFDGVIFGSTTASSADVFNS